MSERKWGSAAIRDCKGAFATTCILAGLIGLVSVAYVASVASADVDSVGGLEKVPTIKSSPHELTPLAGEAGLYQCSSAYQYADVHSEPWGFVIGQCRPGWKFEVLEHTAVNSNHHTSSYGGYLEGAFDACGWIESDEGPEQINEKLPNHCPGLNQKKSTVGNFYEKYNGQPEPTGDGYYIVNKVPCKEYANFRPWSSESVEKEEIRTVPAYALGGEHHFGHEPALKWRYVTEYASTDGSGKYVMVRDDRYNGGEGNWVFVPLSCLRANASELPTGEGEYVPSPPTVATGSATYATPNATLSASINPNSVETKYFFEYGTTESYGSYTTTENAGSGTGPVTVYAPITGLVPGTTYYYRIVASSATGESLGGPVSFTTQPPPAVSTESVSEFNQVQAQLNGSVNPEGLDVHYHFEYGMTESYGSSTSSSDAGAGTSNVHVSAIVIGLEPDTTYHYRLVASSSAGTTYGSGYTFTTPYVIDAFYRGTTGGLHNTLWNGSYWSSGALGPENVMEGNPSAVARPGGVMNVFYRNKKGGLENAYWNGSAWSFGALGPEKVMEGNPSAITLPEGKMDVFYRNKKGGLENAYWNGSAWSFGALGPENVMAGEPSAVARPGGVMDVFYRNKKGGLENAYWNGSAWSFGALGPENVMEGNPAAVSLPEDKMDVFFRNKTGGLENYYWSAAWYFGALGTEKIMAGDPGALALSNGVMDVFYRNTSGAVQNAFWNLSGWSFGPISPEKVVAGETSAVDVL